MHHSLPKCLWASVVLLTALSVLPCRGQSSQSEFEVASVKSGGGVFSTRPQISPGRIMWTTQLAYLVGYANRLEINRISGVGIGAVYSLNATFDPGQSDDNIRRMLQSLLQQRFKLRSHRATKYANGLALVATDGAARLEQSTKNTVQGVVNHPQAGLRPRLKAILKRVS